MPARLRDRTFEWIFGAAGKALERQAGPELRAGCMRATNLHADPGTGSEVRVLRGPAAVSADDGRTIPLGSMGAGEGAARG